MSPSWGTVGGGLPMPEFFGPLFRSAFLVNKESYLIFVIFLHKQNFWRIKFTPKKARKLRQNTQKIANFLRYFGKIHSKLPIFPVKSEKIYTGQKNLHGRRQWCPWQIWGMIIVVLNGSQPSKPGLNNPTIAATTDHHFNNMAKSSLTLTGYQLGKWSRSTNWLITASLHPCSRSTSQVF